MSSSSSSLKERGEYTNQIFTIENKTNPITSASQDDHGDNDDVSNTSHLTMDSDNDESCLNLVPPPASWYADTCMSKSEPADKYNDTDRKGEDGYEIGETSEGKSPNNGDADACLGGTNANGEVSQEGARHTTTNIEFSVQQQMALVKISNNNSKQRINIPSNQSRSGKSIILQKKSKGKRHMKHKRASGGVNIQKEITKNARAIRHLTTELIPNAAQELITASAQKAYHYTRLSYSTSRLFGKFHFSNSEVGNRLGGYDRESIQKGGIRDARTNELLWIDRESAAKNALGQGTGISSTADGIYPQKVKKNQGKGWAWEDEWDKARICLPPFSSLPWVDRQLVKEWRTCDYLTYDNNKKAKKHDSLLEVENYTTSDDDDKRNDKGNIQEEDLTYTDTDVGVAMSISISDMEDFADHEEDFEQARTLQPQPMQKPPWENASSCYACRKPFASSSILLRHHCRLCGRSYCQTHSRWSHRLPHLGYSSDVPERVCAPCKQVLESQNLAERIAWRMARCRDYLSKSDLCPYFETGVDTVEDAAVRLTKAAIHFAKTIPLGAQATVAVETLDVLRKHGLKGVYGLILRKEFMAAADLLCKVTGINKKVWPLSVHELSAAIFYALAQHRALRGVDPEREHRIHTLKRKRKDEEENCGKELMLDNDAEATVDENDNVWSRDLSGSDDDEEEDDGECHAPASNKSHPDVQETPNILVDETDKYDPTFDEKDNLELKEDSSDESSSSYMKKRQFQQTQKHLDPEEQHAVKKTSDPAEKIQQDLPFDPVCEPVSDRLLSSLIFYAPLALNFIYATTEVDMQLLAAQQGWRLIYAHLNQDVQVSDKPASALFVHSEQKIACFAVRGTATINDVVTDIRAMPVQFPDSDMDGLHEDEEGWTPVMKGQGLALCGMAGAACNLFRENIDALLLLARQGYRIRLTGHSLGGSVGALLGALIKRHFEFHLTHELAHQPDILHVYSYGSPACVDAKLSDYAQSYVTNCVLHDDCIPRLTPTSIRALLKHLLYIRETWVKEHLTDDLMAITERAKTAWAPRLRNGFTLMYTANPSIKVYKKLKAGGKSLRKKMKKGKKKLKSMAKSKHSFSSGDQEKGEMDVPRTVLASSPSTNDMSCATALEIIGESDNENYGEDEDEDDGAMFFDGDCFYEAEGSLIEHSDDEESIHGTPPKEERDPSLDEWVPFDEPPPEEYCDMNDGKVHKSNKEQNGDKDEACVEEASSKAVMLAETPLPRMFIPGKIVHIYTHRGAFKAAIVPRAFRELRRITLAGSLLNDHMSKSYYEGLLECKSVREAKKNLPEWTWFGDEKTCCCCASRFTWASTSNNEAQEARDRHNCRACGGLVCDSCSKNRVPIPDIGIYVPSRVCDRCYNDMGGILSTHDAMARSFTSTDNTAIVGKEDAETNKSSGTSGAERSYHDGDDFIRDKQQDSKRNPIVDELAMRMPSAAMSG